MTKGSPLKKVSALSVLSLASIAALPVFAQSRSEKVANITAALVGAVQDEPTEYVDAQTGESNRATPRQLMRETMTAVDFEAMPGKMALEIWSSQTGVPLVINWRSLEAQGIDPEAPITLKLQKVPAELALKLIIDQLHPDPLGNEKLMLKIDQWYVRIFTREDALRNSVTRVYFIGDLLMDIPNFDNAPRVDLNDALSNTSSGGSNGGRGGGSGNGLFDTESDQKEITPTKQERAEQIVDMIVKTIEPEIWRENGGEYGSVRYYRGMLVVKAPEFVHDQIGIPFSTSTRSTSSNRENAYRSGSVNSKQSSQAPRSTSGNVAGVAPRK